MKRHSRAMLVLGAATLAATTIVWILIETDSGTGPRSRPDIQDIASASDRSEVEHEPVGAESQVSAPVSPSVPEPTIASRTLDRVRTAAAELVVTDHDGRRVSEAEVLVFREDTAQPAEQRDAGLGALRGVAESVMRTDPEGRCSLQREGEIARLVVARREGFATGVAWFDPNRDERVEIRLRSGIGLRVQVFDGDTDVRVAGATIAARPFTFVDRPESMPGAELEHRVCSLLATTDRLGEVRLDDLRAQPYSVACRHPGFPWMRVCTDPEIGTLVLRLQRTMALRGTVVDSAGLPIAGADVRALLQGQFPTPTLDTATTDERGAFALANAPTGAMSLSVLKPGHAFEKRRMFLDPGDVVPIEVVLHPQVEFDGVVVDDAGRPVEGAKVVVYDEEMEGDIGSYKTEADGSWWMHAVGEGRPHTVIVEKEGHRRREQFVVAEKETHVTIVLDRFVAMRGRVLDDAGRPVPSFSVRWAPIDEELDSERANLGDEIEEEFASPEGLFTIENLWPCDSDLIVDAPGFEPRTERIRVAHGADAKVEVHLVRGADLSGRVLTEQGEGLPGAVVSLALTDSVGTILGLRRRIASTCDAAGAFTITGAPDAPFAVVIQHTDRGRIAFQDLLRSDFPRDFVLRAPGTIAGIARSPWRSPDTVLAIRVARTGTALATDLPVDHAGEFASGPLAPGAYAVTLFDRWAGGQLDGDPGITRFVEVKPGATSFVELSSATGGAVTGRIRAPSGEPAGARFRALARSAAPDGATSAILGACAVDQDGFFALLGLPFGAIEVGLDRLARGTSADLWQRVELSEGRPRSKVEFVLPQSALEGRVTDRDGAPVDATVTLIDAHGSERTSLRVDEAGSFAILLQHSGAYRLAASAPGFADLLSPPLSFEPEASRPPWLATMEPESRLEVHLLDDRRRPVGHAVVRAAIASPVPSLAARPIPIDARGIGGLRRLASGTIELTATAPGHVPILDRSVALAVGESRVLELQLVRAASLEVHVTSRGRPRCGSQVVLTRPGGDRSSATTASIGVAAFEDLEPGEATLELDGSVATSILLIAGEQLRLPISVD